MTDYIPKRYPAYTIDDEGHIREYQGIDAWVFFKKPNERRIFKKDLPKDFTAYERFADIDV
ncbi:MAG: hypothetical protein IIZ12_03010 [Eggerthellaceae bacterium]|nr:hypothetical protein [Eggerthellaceae bacterium]